MSTSISEFERTKPVVTMKQINNLIEMIDNECERAESVHLDHMTRLHTFSIKLKEIKKSLMKGE